MVNQRQAYIHGRKHRMGILKIGAMELMKKKAIAILIVLCVCTAVFGIYSLSHPRRHSINILERNIDACTKIAEFCLSGNMIPSQASIQDVKEIFSSSSSQVDFICSYSGFGSQTSYYGFYYSLDNTPRTFQGVDVAFQEKQLLCILYNDWKVFHPFHALLWFNS